MLGARRRYFVAGPAVATWLMQQGIEVWEAAGWLGMMVEQIEENMATISRISRTRLRKRLADDAESSHRPTAGTLLRSIGGVTD